MYIRHQESERDKWGRHQWGHCKCCVCLTEGPLVDSSQPTIIFSKVPGRTCFPNFVKILLLLLMIIVIPIIIIIIITVIAIARSAPPKIRYFCSGPLSVDPIRPRPKSALGGSRDVYTILYICYTIVYPIYYTIYIYIYILYYTRYTILYSIYYTKYILYYTLYTILCYTKLYYDIYAILGACLSLSLYIYICIYIYTQI